MLAREGREFGLGQSHDYVRFDNRSDRGAEFLKIQWRLRVLKPFPERWSVIAGDVLTNLRAALDYTFWAAAVSHGGIPDNPHLVSFPLATVEDGSFQNRRRDLRPLVSPAFWDLVESVQPFRLSMPYQSPLEWLRWLSNADKHRAVRVVGRAGVDIGPIVVPNDEEFEIVQERRTTGSLDDGSVVGSVRLRLNPRGSREIELLPTFAYSPSLEVGEDPAEFIPLSVVMGLMTANVLDVINKATSALGETMPSPEELEVGLEHDDIAVENTGIVWTFRDAAGFLHFLEPCPDDPDSAPPDA
ncbi:hypothetical protein [Saccharothrix lopnurensis]|uniref:Uncharacterized protein n=1 Tax=Saccharothrix lopnurensis TaxID=1670621 RepID=A0ABW1PFJ9_9PSEU